ncbi:pathogen-associated molecular patterns-induced protein A70-like [Triticum dicoccoides]|uniref:pathogen-associated molecular patterns-induced protein A70-like n=1 Tax=Triticum dicoccoides TaxID=85692 RepID=UPI000E7BCE7B|nr:pathogen-associated molecular patterns-induced protein A70-like [Triticum dicoccoides]
MLEAAAIPELWSTVHGWFTPWVLFLMLNLVVFTIVVTSMATAPAKGGEGAAPGADCERRNLAGRPSMELDRHRSPNLPRFTAPAPEAPATGVLDLGQPDNQPPPLEMEPENPGEREHAHMERSMSEAAVEAELPRRPARLRKSAFAHVVAKKDTEVVEVRRLATTTDAERRRPLVVKVEEPASEEEIQEAGSEVDARADEFINKFHHQLKQQRIDSFRRSRNTLHRRRTAVLPEAR